MTLHRQLWLVTVALLLLVVIATTAAGILILQDALAAQPAAADSDALWHGGRRLALFCVGVALAAAGVAWLVLRRLLAPLDGILAQARALGERRFVTVAEPEAREFAGLTRAMNGVSQHFRDTLAREGGRLGDLQGERDLDPATGLLARGAFRDRLEAALAAEDDSGNGAVCLLRIAGLAELNQVYGRDAVNAALATAGRALAVLGPDRDWSAARLGGADIAVLAPRAEDPLAIAALLQESVAAALAEHSLEPAPALPAAAADYRHGDDARELMARLDAALLAASRDAAGDPLLAARGDVAATPLREQLELWRERLTEAFARGQFTLQPLPVLRTDGGPLHREALLRLTGDGKPLPAARLLPWINRLDLAGQLDRTVLGLALTEAANSEEPLALNLSAAALRDAEFQGWLDERAGAAAAASRLCLEVSEAAAHAHAAGFSTLCRIGRRHGMQLGVDHAGRRLADIAQLLELGVDYLKLDALYVTGLETNSHRRDLLRALTTLVHAAGITLVATGVQNARQWQLLRELGVDAGAGPGVPAP
jgi:EAL domain-containing protein (putative c-di-GMP-specific phosphodiesterase class I)/GGDEF domain-containing protein